MKNAGNKRPILILLALAIILFSGMALGSTFASQVNKTDGQDQLDATDGKYNVVVKYHDGTGYTKSLDDKTPVLTKDILWCPGYTKIVYFQLTNEEAFPVECTLTMTAKESDLNQALTYAVLGNLQPDSANHPKSWKEVTAEKSQLESGKQVAIIKEATLVDDTSQYCAIAIHMDENAGNQYLNKSVDIDFQLVINANYKPSETPASSAQF